MSPRAEIASDMSESLVRQGPLVIARAPTRIDFGGGWTDVPPYSEEEGGFVCNLAIARYATARVFTAGEMHDAASPSPDSDLARAVARRAGLGDAQLIVESDFPFGAGLGGSSAAGVAAVGAVVALRGGTQDRSALAEASRRIEVEDLQIAGGRQDHYAAAYGGALALRFGADGTEVKRIPLTPETITALERRLIVTYTGHSRISGATITAVLDAYRDRDSRVCAALAMTRSLAMDMAGALAHGNLDELGVLVHEQWQRQKALHEAITTPRIERVVAAATNAGALGVKALGASGGGCVLAIAADGREEEVRTAVSALGDLLAFAIDTRGFHVVENE
jgi:D-glycero-alpha-D-manno-heptose-7-phosphate kinase